MLWSIVWFYEAMCITGFVTYFVVAFTKEIVHYVKTNDNRFERLENYLRRNYGIRREDITKRDLVEAVIRWSLAGWYYGVMCLNMYYEFLEYDAEQQKEKA